MKPKMRLCKLKARTYQIPFRGFQPTTYNVKANSRSLLLSTFPVQTFV